MANINVRERNCGIDVLKILLAMMVIAIHFDAPATGHASSTVTWFPTKMFLYSAFALNFPAVNTYVLICGFFSYSIKKDINGVIKSLTRLWACLFSYSVIGLVIRSFYYGELPSFSGVISHIFPVCSSQWWFMTVYFVLLLISPALNMLVDRSTLKHDVWFILLALSLFAVVPIFMGYEDNIGHNLGYGLIWFVILYVTGALLCKYMNSPLVKSVCFSKPFILYVFTSILFLSYNFLCSKIVVLNGHGLQGYNNIVSWFQALFLFCTFYNLNVSVKFCKIINIIAGLSLASYVFHCQPDISDLIWDAIEPSRYSNSLFIVVVFFCTVIGLYSISIILEYMRGVWLNAYLKFDSYVFGVIKKFEINIDRIIAVQKNNFLN